MLRGCVDIAARQQRFGIRVFLPLGKLPFQASELYLPCAVTLAGVAAGL